jgi:adenylate kinase family enzyme
LKRVCIVGCSGSGKTTLGRVLAARLGGEAIDLDELVWEPGWHKVPDQEFCRRLEEALEAPCWVTSGNYSNAQHIYLKHADVMLWLDYSFTVVFYRILIRTWRRTILRESCCNGNFESIRRTFSRDSIVWWMITSFHRRRRQYEQVFSAGIEGVEIVRHRSPRETRRWLNQLNVAPQTVPNSP